MTMNRIVLIVLILLLSACRDNIPHKEPRYTVTHLTTTGDTLFFSTSVDNWYGGSYGSGVHVLEDGRKRYLQGGIIIIERNE